MECEEVEGEEMEGEERDGNDEDVDEASDDGANAMQMIKKPRISGVMRCEQMLERFGGAYGCDLPAGHAGPHRSDVYGKRGMHSA
jgi:hypothetical protein